MKNTNQNTITVTPHDIRSKAYHLWEQEGRPVGRDHEFWFKAERELLGRNGASQVLESPATLVSLSGLSASAPEPVRGEAGNGQSSSKAKAPARTQARKRTRASR